LGVCFGSKKQTFATQKGMSALPPKADICSANTNVRYGPKADMPALAIRIVLAIVGAVSSGDAQYSASPYRAQSLAGLFWEAMARLNDFGWIKELRRKCGQEPISLFLRSDGLSVFANLWCLRVFRSKRGS